MSIAFGAERFSFLAHELAVLMTTVYRSLAINPVVSFVRNLVDLLTVQIVTRAAVGGQSFSSPFAILMVVRSCR